MIARILHAPIVPRWEALVRSAHHSTSIRGNPLSLQEVTDLLTGRVDRHFLGQEQPITEQTIPYLHALVVKGILPPTETSQYRCAPVVVGVLTTGDFVYRPLDWQDVPELVAASSPTSTASAATISSTSRALFRSSSPTTTPAGQKRNPPDRLRPLCRRGSGSGETVVQKKG